jgi:hypothetical protein
LEKSKAFVISRDHPLDAPVCYVLGENLNPSIKLMEEVKEIPVGVLI